MKYGIYLFVTILLSALAACTSSHDKMLRNITAMESKLKSGNELDSNAISALMGAWQNFAAKYPNDSVAPEFLYKAAGVAGDIRRGNQSIDLYESIIQKYPGYHRIAECYFMEAFTYENSLGNIGKAAGLYSTFLDKYPHHALAADARAALNFLGKSSDEIVSELEQIQADSVATAQHK